MITSVRHCLN